MNNEKTWGEWAFLTGLIIAVLVGLNPYSVQTPWVGPTMVILGLLIGLLNVSSKETTKFLVAAIALLLVGNGGFATLPWLGQYIDAILWNIELLVAPATLIVALKAFVEMARSR